MTKNIDFIRIGLISSVTIASVASVIAACGAIIGLVLIGVSQNIWRTTTGNISDIPAAYAGTATLQIGAVFIIVGLLLLTVSILVVIFSVRALRRRPQYRKTLR